MCGIVGYIGYKNATPIVINGLKKLEYRGYDSAGIAILQDNRIEIRRDKGKLGNLEKLLLDNPPVGSIGIGHTRWATHGIPSQKNAHPHIGRTKEVVVVHNGIVENYLELKEELISEGIEFNSDTDTEIIVHLIEMYIEQGFNLTESVTRALHHIKGAHGVVIMSTKEPDKIIAARIGNAGGVVVGYGENEMYVASDIPAILEHTNKMVFLESRQIAIVTNSDMTLINLEGEKVNHNITKIALDPVSAEKGEYRHFMQKEIFEQVRSITDTLAGRVEFETGKINLPQLNINKKLVENIEKIFITACGTASHAGMVGKILIEKNARIPVEVEIASEFRYADPIVDEKTLVIAISQSGETADTLAAMEEAKNKGAIVWSIVNAIGSQAMRVADGCISMQTGPEIGVASTKAFTAPLVDLYMLSVLLGSVNEYLDKKTINKYINDLRLIPDLVGQCLNREEEVIQIAEKLRYSNNALYLGRGINMPIAYEGALKLKEISYIHAEAYPAGEMKHGPIALIDEDMPVIVISPKDPWREKMISQIEQAKTRGGKVYVVATDGDEIIADLADDIMWIPDTPWMLSPVISVIPLQLLAYHIAAMRGLDVDQPRNLAKSVTVE